MPGGYGSGFMYYAAKRIVLFRTEHSKRTFVPKVDFVSGAMKTNANVKRPQNASKVVTTMAVLSWDYGDERWALESVHEGYTVEDVMENTGVELKTSDPVMTTPPPSAEELHALRTVVKERMIETGTYPEFAQTRLQPA